MPYREGQQLQLLEGESGGGAYLAKKMKKSKKRNMGDFLAGYSGVVLLGRINPRENVS